MKNISVSVTCTGLTTAKLPLKRRGAVISLLSEQIAALPDSLAVLLVLLPIVRGYPMLSDSWQQCKWRVWAWIDLSSGGLTAAGMKHFKNDPVVLAAAAEHKTATQARNKRWERTKQRQKVRRQKIETGKKNGLNKDGKIRLQ